MTDIGVEVGTGVHVSAGGEPTARVADVQPPKLSITVEFSSVLSPSFPFFPLLSLLSFVI